MKTPFDDLWLETLQNQVRRLELRGDVCDAVDACVGSYVEMREHIIEQQKGLKVAQDKHKIATYCAFCGITIYTAPGDEEEEGKKLITEHVLGCGKHPLNQRIVELEAQCERSMAVRRAMGAELRRLGKPWACDTHCANYGSEECSPCLDVDNDYDVMMPISKEPVKEEVDACNGTKGYFDIVFDSPLYQEPLSRFIGVRDETRTRVHVEQFERSDGYWVIRVPRITDSARVAELEEQLRPGSLTERAPTQAAYDKACEALHKHTERERGLEKQLLDAGYTDKGGELLKPPIGPSPAPFLNRIDELEEQLVGSKIAWEKTWRKQNAKITKLEKQLADSLAQMLTVNQNWTNGEQIMLEKVRANDALKAENKKFRKALEKIALPSKQVRHRGNIARVALGKHHPPKANSGSCDICIHGPEAMGEVCADCVANDEFEAKTYAQMTGTQESE